jgi:ABC-type glutathione transport system ATPase component
MAQVLPAKRQHAFENGVSSYNRASQQGRVSAPALASNTCSQVTQEKRPRYSLREVSEASEASEDSSSEDEPETSEADQPVEDDYDENEDLSDREYTQHIIQRLKNSENKENRPEESGVIEEIRCVNFMCHEQLTVTLGPLINFIIGHNGSGKSAVLTALTICLGGKATATNRGQNLKSFVKEGKE